MARQHVLIVDADSSSRRLLEVSLKKAGYQVTPACDGAEALGLLEHADPDIILAETQLPGRDGFAFCAAVKAVPARASVPFVFLTVATSLDDKIRGLELGADDYLVKPVYIKEITSRIAALLQRRERLRIEHESVARTKFTGQLADIAVVDLLQTIQISGKRGLVNVTNNGARGSMWFAEGRVLDAECGDLRGAPAVYRLLTWSQGSFEVDFRPIDRPAKIPDTTQGLLMEGLRRLDEWGRLLEQLPPVTSRLHVVEQRLSKRMEPLSANQRTVVALFNGTRSIHDVVDQSGLDDLVALGSIAALYFDGLIASLDPLEDPVVMALGQHEPELSSRDEPWTSVGAPLTDREDAADNDKQISLFEERDYTTWPELEEFALDLQEHSPEQAPGGSTSHASLPVVSASALQSRGDAPSPGDSLSAGNSPTTASRFAATESTGDSTDRSGGAAVSEAPPSTHTPHYEPAAVDATTRRDTDEVAHPASGARLSSATMEQMGGRPSADSDFGGHVPLDSISETHDVVIEPSSRPSTDPWTPAPQVAQAIPVASASFGSSRALTPIDSTTDAVSAGNPVAVPATSDVTSAGTPVAISPTSDAKRAGTLVAESPTSGDEVDRDVFGVPSAWPRFRASEAAWPLPGAAAPRIASEGEPNDEAPSPGKTTALHGRSPRLARDNDLQSASTDDLPPTSHCDIQYAHAESEFATQPYEDVSRPQIVPDLPVAGSHIVSSAPWDDATNESLTASPARSKDALLQQPLGPRAGVERLTSRNGIVQPPMGTARAFAAGSLPATSRAGGASESQTNLVATSDEDFDRLRAVALGDAETMAGKRARRVASEASPLSEPSGRPGSARPRRELEQVDERTNSSRAAEIEFAEVWAEASRHASSDADTTPPQETIRALVPTRRALMQRPSKVPPPVRAAARSVGLAVAGALATFAVLWMARESNNGDATSQRDAAPQRHAVGSEPASELTPATSAPRRSPGTDKPVAPTPVVSSEVPTVPTADPSTGTEPAAPTLAKRSSAPPPPNQPATTQPTKGTGVDDALIEQFLAAEQAFDARRFGDAKTTATGIVERAPNYAPAHLLLAQIALEEGAYSKAGAAAERAAKLDPTSAQAQLSLGVAHESLGEFEQALRSYRQFLQLDPGSPYAPAITRQVASLQARMGG